MKSGWVAGSDLLAICRGKRQRLPFICLDGVGCH
uniref:Uncharacterized protein n=1 Tax=Rhizophora mucronata TaxID=61149 RepID=A0A2P2R046_RHIMU